MYEPIDGEAENNHVMEDTTAQATLDSMEEMLEGYEWATDDIMGRRSMTGAADRMEARLLDELMALDKVGLVDGYVTSTLTFYRSQGEHTLIHRV